MSFSLNTFGPSPPTPPAVFSMECGMIPEDTLELHGYFPYTSAPNSWVMPFTPDRLPGVLPRLFSFPSPARPCLPRLTTCRQLASCFDGVGQAVHNVRRQWVFVRSAPRCGCPVLSTCFSPWGFWSTWSEKGQHRRRSKASACWAGPGPGTHCRALAKAGWSRWWAHSPTGPPIAPKLDLYLGPFSFSGQ